MLKLNNVILNLRTLGLVFFVHLSIFIVKLGREGGGIPITYNVIAS